MSAKIAVGVVNMFCAGLAERYGLAREECLAHSGLDESALSDPEGMVELQALVALFRFAQSHTQDPGLGLALARTWDLRQQGFWGYALLSSNSLRERLDGHVRYQSLRSPMRLTLTEADGVVSVDVGMPMLPEDVLQTFVDWSIATSLLHLREQLGGAPSALQLWLSYPEKPHHGALRALFEGEIVFDAPCVRLRFPAAMLDQGLRGDAYLGRLARGQLDARLPPAEALSPDVLVPQVRERIAACLERDASLTRVARELGLGARTLQRQLEAQHTSFQALSEEVRKGHALRSIGETAQSVRQLAARLGYADAASFRRAFRRWTGVSPVRYRQAQRDSDLARLTRDARRPTRKVSGA